MLLKNSFYFETIRKSKAEGIVVLIHHTSRVNVSDRAFWSLLFVVPISQLSPKNVFLSPRTSDGVSAQQKKTVVSVACV